MWLRAPTACPEWNEGMDEDKKVLHWLSKNAGLTSECITEEIEPFTRRRSENTLTGKTWNEAAKHAAAKQVTQPRPRSVKAVESTTAPLSGTFKQYTLLNQLSDAVKVQTKPSDNSMIVDEPAKPVAGSSKLSGDTPSHTSAVPDSTPLHSAPISKLRSALKSELHSAFTSGVTVDVK